MLANFRTTGIRTEKGTLGYTVNASAVSTARSGRSTAQKRGNVRSMFSGGVAYNKSNSSQPLTALLEITDGTTSRVLDRVTVQKGDSTVWREEDFGIVLEPDEYAKVTCVETFASGDVMNVFLHSKDII